MDFEKGDYIVNLNKLKATLFDELVKFSMDKEIGADGDMVFDKLMSYMEAINLIVEVGSAVGDK